MNERTPFSAENVPTEGEVIRVMERLLDGVEFTETERVEKDGELWSLRYETVDSTGDRVVYEYGVRTPDTSVDSRTAVIHVTFYDNENIPVGGHNLADYERGVWKFEENA
jgi:hypothetical protein